MALGGEALVVHAVRSMRDSGVVAAAVVTARADALAEFRAVLAAAGFAETGEFPVRVVPGKYHSVNPIALLRYPDVYADNERQIVACDADFGRFWLVDVGAFGVGTIVQTYSGETHAKGDEKGYFKFGGSTVIFIARANALAFDDDLVRNSAAGLETRVRCGERIAVVKA